MMAAACGRVPMPVRVGECCGPMYIWACMHVSFVQAAKTDRPCTHRRRRPPCTHARAQAFKAAEAAKKARELVRRKSVLTKSTLPGKLADCSSSSRDECEIFLVEGDSAGALCRCMCVRVHVPPQRGDFSWWRATRRKGRRPCVRVHCRGG